MTVFEIFGSNDFFPIKSGKMKGVEENSNNVSHFKSTSSDRIFFDDHNCKSYVECCEKTAQDPSKTDFDWVFANLNPINPLKLK